MTAGSPAMGSPRSIAVIGWPRAYSGDDYFGGVLRRSLAGRGSQADSLWRWPTGRRPTSEISAAHLAPASGQVRSAARALANLSAWKLDLHPAPPGTVPWAIITGTRSPESWRSRGRLNERA
jgi:hypothetical protein